MIPKVIHYCWFGKGLMPQSQRECISKWKKILPEYEIKRWDESNFDIAFCDYSLKAYEHGKYAYVSDVARCNILYRYGGIYLDTDVELFSNFDSLLSYNFFSAIEVYKEFVEEGKPLLNKDGRPRDSELFVPYLGFLSSIIGTVPGNPLIKDCLDYYIGIEVSEFKGFAIDGLIANKAMKYGFVYKDQKQLLQNNMLILPTGVFGYADAINSQYSTLYHHNAGSWASKSDYELFLLKLDKLHLLNVYNKLKLIKRKLKNLLK